MPRTSPEVRRAERQRLAEIEAANEKAERMKFQLALPHQLLLLAARIHPFGEAIVKPNGDAYNVEYRFHDHPLENVSLGIETEKWAVDSLWSTIIGLEEEAHRRAQKLRVAREGWAALTEEQRAAMVDLGIARQP